MMTRWRVLAPVFAAAVCTLGCGNDSTMPGEGGSGGTGSGGTGGGSAVDRGAATLTIGNETWEFDGFGCAFGYEATQTDEYSFSSTALGEHSNGARVQMQAEIIDDTGQERVEGDGVVYVVYVADTENFENPAVDWEANGPEDVIVVNIDGNNVTAEGVFDNLLTDGVVEEEPGTLTATCGTQSIR